MVNFAQLVNLIPSALVLAMTPANTGGAGDRLDPHQLWTHISPVQLLLFIILFTVTVTTVIKALIRRLQPNRGIPDPDNRVDPQILKPGVETVLRVALKDNFATIHSNMVSVDRRYLIVITNLNGSEFNSLPIGCTVEGTAVLSKAAYLFTCTLADRRLDEVLATLYLTRPPYLLRVQRRKFYRVPVDIGIVFTVSGSNEDPASGTVVDISAGGLRVITSKAVRAGALVKLRLPLITYAGDPICNARVLVSRPMSGVTSRGRYLLQLELLDTTEALRDAIVALVFATQRSLARAKTGPPKDYSRQIKK